MCGIMGFHEKKNQVNKKNIIDMMSTLKHRGPDDQGYEIIDLFGKESNVALGFVRLSIRDLSEAGHQPMWNTSRTICITFNGEIYNADDFRSELLNQGFVFKGTSDTEVLLDLYELYGIEQTLEKIDGMFTFSIYDSKKDCIYFARDRIGEKPLYFYENDDVLMWASEYKAFFCHPKFKSQLEEKNITEYLMYRYISNGETLLRDVKNLLPGHYAVLTGSGFDVKEYWNVSEATNSDMQQEINYEELLRKAVESRLVSDVPVGVQLSGGVDSTAVTRYVSDKIGNKAQVFGIVFDTKENNEEEYIEAVARRCSLNLEKIKLNGSEFLSNWIDTTYYFEAPMNHPGTVCLLQLNRQAKKKVSVLLCGEGADETLGGYSRFPRYLYYEQHPVKYSIYLLLQRIKNKDLIGVIEGKSFAQNFIKETQYVNSTLVNKIYKNADTRSVIAKRVNIYGQQEEKVLRSLLNYEIKTYLQDILMRADKISMAASVELRVPFLQPSLIQKEGCIDNARLVKPVFRDNSSCAKNSKIILKELVSDYMGESFTYRNKVGLAVDIKYYFEQPDVKTYIEEKLLPGIHNRQILKYEVISNMWSSITKSSDRKSIEALWVALSFEMWCQMYLDSSPCKVVK